MAYVSICGNSMMYNEYAQLINTPTLCYIFISRDDFMLCIHAAMHTVMHFVCDGLQYLCESDIIWIIRIADKSDVLNSG